MPETPVGFFVAGASNAAMIAQQLQLESKGCRVTH
jgi:hypothetical protein